MRKSTLIGGLAGLAASMILVLPPPAVSAASAFSDQWVVLRNEDGVPITVTHYDADAGEVECLQPISYYEIPDVDPEPNPVDGRMVYVVPLNGEGSTETAPVVDACSVPNDGAYANGGGARATEPRSDLRRGALEEARRGGCTACWCGSDRSVSDGHWNFARRRRPDHDLERRSLGSVNDHPIRNRRLSRLRRDLCRSTRSPPGAPSGHRREARNGKTRWSDGHRDHSVLGA